MKLFKYVLPMAVAAVGFVASAFAGCFEECDHFNERDYDGVYSYIKSHRIIPLNEKSCDLMISGDVRFEWANVKETHDGFRRRGKGANTILNDSRESNGNGITDDVADENAFVYGHRLPKNEFEAEFNLWIDYKGSCTWAVTHLMFDNRAGIEQNFRECCGREVVGCGSDGSTFVEGRTAGDRYGCQGSGCCENLCLYRAYFGYNIFEECNSRLDIEIGRRPLWDIFDSRVQFGNRFDGVLLRYSNSFECVGDFYVTLGGFVVDYTVDHYAGVLETGLLDIADMGLDLKYSIINWRNKGCNRCEVTDAWGMRFLISQFTFAYNLDPEWFCTRAKLYGAVLVNHYAKARVETNDSKKGLAWYAGFEIGEIRQEGDWHLDFNYQWVEAQSIPDCDFSGIGRGNAKCIPFTVSNLWGNVNYHGINLEAIYALTDNIVLNPKYYWANHQDSTIGGKHEFSQFEIEFIYSF